MFRWIWMRLQEQQGGDGGAGGGGGSGASGDGGDAGAGGDGSGQGSGKGGMMSGAGAGGQGGDKGAGGAGDGGAGEGGDGGQGDGAAGDGAWLWQENVPGEGTAPPWFKGSKYKSIAEQAKAAGELEGKLGAAAKVLGAPEADYTLPDKIEGVEGWQWDTADPLLNTWREAAKELGLSQSSFDQVATRVAKVLAEQQHTEELAVADALAAVGPNAGQRMSAVEGWIRSTFSDEAFSELDQAIGTNVKAYLALEQIVARASGDAQLSGHRGKGGPGFTKEDIQSEQYKVFPDGHPMAGKRMYDHDKEHRAKVDGMWKQLFPGEDRQEVG